ncbi:MAG TPA: FAD-binding oxidoreductase, partial [Solirubrobacteraceae bacterium]|nr:FAD-binding oxidoreductase [Solirubrobacteraceae bacterium]
MPRRRKHWGWGFEDEQPGGAELRDAATGLAAHLGFGVPEPAMPAPVALPAPRLDVPSGWATDDHARALAAHGASYLDVVRAFRGEFPHPPDAVARPGDESELAAVLAWCAERGVAAIPR